MAGTRSARREPAACAGASAGSVQRLRGPAVCLRRDALFRRSLLVADVVAIVGALVLTVALSSRRVPLHLTWESLVGVPLLLVGAKLLGLYDRDETLLRKTTLDEAPKLFQLATLCTLVALAGGRPGRGRHARPPARRCSCGSSLAALLILVRADRPQHRAADRARPSAACSSAMRRSAATIRCKLDRARRDQGDRSSRTSTSTRSRRGRRDALLGAAPRRDPRPRSDARRAPRDHRAALERRRRSEMLNLVRTLKAVGVRVSVLPRLLEVVGSSVEFDDLHGVTVMGVRRFDLDALLGGVQARASTCSARRSGCSRSRRC